MTPTSFLQDALGAQPWRIHRVAGDASFRCYYRITTPQARFILMEAPPDKEDAAPFLDIAHFFHRFGVPAPQIIHSCLDTGYLLLEDFGDLTLFKAVTQAGGVADDPAPAILSGDMHPLYHAAIETLLKIQATPIDGTTLAHRRFFDEAMMRRELALFTDWYIEKVVARPLSQADRKRFDTLFSTLIDALLAQPVVLVHRDYHSRNLMWHAGGLGVLDFQDAVIGPITYDLASLLRDCYVAWPSPFREHLMRRWLDGARRHVGYEPRDWPSFQRDLDWMAIQRNLKAIGIFGRLSHRDGKHGYLNDIPRTLTYIRHTVKCYPKLAMLDRLLDRYVATP